MRLEFGFQCPSAWTSFEMPEEHTKRAVETALDLNVQLRGNPNVVPLGLFAHDFAANLLDFTTRSNIPGFTPKPWWIQPVDPLTLVETVGVGIEVECRFVPLRASRFAVWEIRGIEQEHRDEIRRLRVLLSHLHGDLMGLGIVLPLVQSGRLNPKNPEFGEYINRTCGHLLTGESFGYAQHPYIAVMLKTFSRHYLDKIVSLRASSVSVESKGLRRKIIEAANLLEGLSAIEFPARVDVAAYAGKGKEGKRDMPEKLQTTQDPRSVFLVHGRDEKTAQEMRSLLRALGLTIVDWEDAKASLKQGAPYIGDIVLEGMRLAHAVVVLFTADENVQLRSGLAGGPGGDENGQQSRPNVYYEAGVADALNRDRTVLVEVGNVRKFTDDAGRHAVRFDGGSESRLKLRNALRNAGLTVDDRAHDWMHEGDFSPDLQTP
ncbi:TIR domain-containing protein [Streptomyces sp. A1547]|uniref:TIR domain-containing protein n=1 Tax=Streptomyces sp. A1547 TaxID=2563105 RepID=UPI00144A5C01|nr:TIR domain-containing protein [Streptomyces sp. A1547]